MPTIMTHALAGAALGQAAPAGIPKFRLSVCLGCAAMLPDLDVIMFALKIPYSHVLGHRGFSHSVIFAMVLAPLITWLAGYAADPKRYFNTGLIFLAAILSHGILDALTDAGLGVGFFIPFTDERHFLPWRPVMTASLNPSSFLSRETLRILESEAVYIWLPLTAVIFLFSIIRRVKNCPGAETSAPGK
ncbi:MAG: metal-dependent hydrolase [Desulfobacterales bacterium]|nr:metal-dependent hydrolase [Desulfobacterales bacterium]